MQFLICALLRAHWAFWLGRYDPLKKTVIVLSLTKRKNIAKVSMKFKFSNKFSKGRECVPCLM